VILCRSDLDSVSGSDFGDDASAKREEDEDNDATNITSDEDQDAD
jgi:hypothetical protein